MTKPILLTGNGCPACTMLKNRLESEGLLDKVDVKNVHEDNSAQDLLMELGIRSIPVLSRGADTLIGASHPIEKYKEFLND